MSPQKTTKKKANGSERSCSNCNKQVKIGNALTVTNHGRLVAVICDACQQAKKIQLTLTKDHDFWAFEQYFPLEG